MGRVCLWLVGGVNSMAHCSQSSSLLWKPICGIIPVHIHSIIAVMEMLSAYLWTRVRVAEGFVTSAE